MSARRHIEKRNTEGSSCSIPGTRFQRSVISTNAACVLVRRRAVKKFTHTPHVRGNTTGQCVTLGHTPQGQGQRRRRGRAWTGADFLGPVDQKTCHGNNSTRKRVATPNPAAGSSARGNTRRKTQPKTFSHSVPDTDGRTPESDRQNAPGDANGHDCQGLYDFGRSKRQTHDRQQFTTATQGTISCFFRFFFGLALPRQHQHQRLAARNPQVSLRSAPPPPTPCTNSAGTREPPPAKSGTPPHPARLCAAEVSTPSAPLTLSPALQPQPQPQPYVECTHSSSARSARSAPQKTSSAKLRNRLSQVLELLPEIVALRLEGQVGRPQLLDLGDEELLLSLEGGLLGLPSLLLEPQHVFQDLRLVERELEHSRRSRRIRSRGTETEKETERRRRERNRLPLLSTFGGENSRQFVVATNLETVHLPMVFEFTVLHLIRKLLLANAKSIPHYLHFFLCSQNASSILKR